MGKPITVQDATSVQDVRLKDKSTDALRVYRARPLTRSVKRSLAEYQKKAEFYEELEDPTPEQEDEAVRLVCDMLDVILEAKADDGPAAGDLLFEAWQNDRVTELQIGQVLRSLLTATADPT